MEANLWTQVFWDYWPFFLAAGIALVTAINTRTWLKERRGR
jgi:hypothetical protein